MGSRDELEVYQLAFGAAMSFFGVSKRFPGEERHSLMNQVRRSSRPVCSNIAEAWRKRRYEAPIMGKLNDAESEAAGKELHQTCNHTVARSVNMVISPSPWTVKASSRSSYLCTSAPQDLGTGKEKHGAERQHPGSG